MNYYHLFYTNETKMFLFLRYVSKVGLYDSN